MTIHPANSPTRTPTSFLGQLNDIPAAQWEYLIVFVKQQRNDWYEYWANGEKIDGLENKPIHIVLNVIGSMGWELVNITPEGDYYFKRPGS